MIRVVFFLAFVLAVALGFAWIADRPGQVVITWLGRTMELDILTAIIAFLVATIALTIVWSLLRLILRLPSIIALASRSRRRQKGFEAVARGMVAVSAGDARIAQKQAAEAQRLLGREPLTMLLTAQSAQLAGDGGKAEKAFTAMLEHKDTRLVGLRGLHIEASRKGDGDAAHFYAAEAYKLAPAADWASEAALAQRCRDRDWLGAMALVEQAASRRLIDKETARRQRAVLLAADALDRDGTEPEGALRAAKEAVKLAPSLAPAAAYLGRKLSDKTDYRGASKVLETAWRQQPHPDLAEAYLDVRIGDAAQDRLKRAKTLQRLCPRDPESRLIVARAALDARDFRQARENLETLVLESPAVRACLLMAELEEAEHGDMGRVREWLARASRAPRDKAWVADGRVSETWAPVSPSGKLDGYEWTVPPQAPHGMLIEEIRSAPPPAPPMVEAAPMPEAMPEPIDVGLPEPKVEPVKPAETAQAEAKAPEPTSSRTWPTQTAPAAPKRARATAPEPKSVEPTQPAAPLATPRAEGPASEPQAVAFASVQQTGEASREQPRRWYQPIEPPQPVAPEHAAPEPASGVEGTPVETKPKRWFQP